MWENTPAIPNHPKTFLHCYKFSRLAANFPLFECLFYPHLPVHNYTCPKEVTLSSIWRMWPRWSVGGGQDGQQVVDKWSIVNQVVDGHGSGKQQGGRGEHHSVFLGPRVPRGIPSPMGWFVKDTINCSQKKSFQPNHAYSCLGFGKIFNVLQSPIGRVAPRPMRNIEAFPSKQLYLYISLVERKLAKFYYNIK